MNINKNYYKILEISDKFISSNDIKILYRKLSKKYHPDINKGIDITFFNEITEAYNILCSENRKEYDSKSKFGNSYDEYYELLNVDFNVNYDSVKENLEKFKKDEILDVLIRVYGDFDGTIEYDRWVICKKCDGTGRDISSKIVVRDNDGNILKIFDADDGCDFCEGSGKDYAGNNCYFCKGQGKVGLENCETCKGEQRILGKQKVKGIKLINNEAKVDAMGHASKSEIGKVGHLFIKKDE